MVIKRAPDIPVAIYIYIYIWQLKEISVSGGLITKYIDETAVSSGTHAVSGGKHAVSSGKHAVSGGLITKYIDEGAFNYQIY